MKNKRILALVMGTALSIGVFSGCSQPLAETAEAMPTETVTAEATEEVQGQESPVVSNEPSSIPTPTPEIEASKAPSAAVEEEGSTAALSEDPYSFQISFDGTVIQLPCPASDLMAIGYSFEDKADNILESGYTTSGLMKMENGNYISVGLYNITGEEKPFSECMIDDIYIHDTNCEGQSIIISNGITFGATPEQVKGIYGEEADNVFDESPSLYLTYEREDDYANFVKFMFKDNILYEIQLCTRGE